MLLVSATDLDMESQSADCLLPPARRRFRLLPQSPSSLQVVTLPGIPTTATF